MAPKVSDPALGQRDVFLIHASEDKGEVVRPLMEAFRRRAITAWLDEAEITWGDSIPALISQGLASSKYVIVVISDAFLRKPWPRAELENVIMEENSTGAKRLLPLLTIKPELLFAREDMFLLRRKLCHVFHLNDPHKSADVAAEQLARLLGRESREEWLYCFPADYSGPVWARLLLPNPYLPVEVTFRIEWGGWSYARRILVTQSPLSLTFAKSPDGHSYPVKVTVSPPANVTFGTGIAPDPPEAQMDINHGWQGPPLEVLLSALLKLLPGWRKGR